MERSARKEGGTEQTIVMQRFADLTEDLRSVATNVAQLTKELQHTALAIERGKTDLVAQLGRVAVDMTEIRTSHMHLCTRVDKLEETTKNGKRQRLNMATAVVVAIISAVTSVAVALIGGLFR